MDDKHIPNNLHTMNNFNIRLGKFELRSTGEHLIGTNSKHITAEIVRWHNNGTTSCHTIFYFQEGKLLRGHYHKKSKKIKKLIKLGYKLIKLL